MNRKFLAAAMLALGSIGLSACGETAEQAAPAVEGIEGMTVSNARLVLPAVAGNPAAVYFDLSYDSDKAVALSRVKVEGAESAEFHEYGEWAGKTQMQPMLPLPLKEGDKHSFEPGGKHVMAMKLSSEVKAGDTANVTIAVSGGADMTFPAEVRAAGSER